DATGGLRTTATPHDRKVRKRPARRAPAAALHTEQRAPCPPHGCERPARRAPATALHTRRTACPPAPRTVATCVAAPSAPASPTTDTGRARSGLFRADDVVPLADGRQGRQLEGHAPGVVLTDAAHPILPLRRIVSAHGDLRPVAVDAARVAP